MKTTSLPIRRALAGLIPATVLLATPAIAQEVVPPPAPPPAEVIVPQAAPPPAPATAPPPASTPQATPPSTESGRPVVDTTTDPASRTTLSPGAQAALDEARAARSARPTRTAAPAPRTVTRTTPRTQAPVAASPPVAPAPVAPEPAAAPVVAAPEAVPTAAPTEAVAAPAPAAEEGAPIWPLFSIAAIAVLGGLGFLAWRRRKATEEDQWVEAEYVAEAEPEVYAAPIPEPAPEPVHATDVAGGQGWQVTAPVIRPRRPTVANAAAATPVEAVAAEDVTVSEAEAADVASLTDGPAPLAGRPWLEFAMRPVRAGTSEDEALVEIELTVANAGNVTAEDVRISTFMLPAASDGDMERLLLAPADANAASTTIDPGEGTRIDATLAMLKTAIGAGGTGGGFTPIVIADARYRLPDGSEGRTSAAFAVGMPNDGGALTPFALDEAGMHDDIEARLHGEPQRA